MQNQTPIPKPAFIVTARDAEINHDLVEFGRDIFAEPEKYVPIINTVGTMAVASAQEEKLEIDGDRASKVRHYFLYEHDYDVEYDETTEAALEADPDHQRLIDARQKMPMAEEYDDHNNVRKVKTPEQRQLSEQIRHARLAFFVNRVVEWKALQDDDNLRSAG